jgi:hypothetical protein
MKDLKQTTSYKWTEMRFFIWLVECYYSSVLFTRFLNLIVRSYLFRDFRSALHCTSIQGCLFSIQITAYYRNLSCSFPTQRFIFRMSHCRNACVEKSIRLFFSRAKLSICRLVKSGQVRVNFYSIFRLAK